MIIGIQWNFLIDSLIHCNMWSRTLFFYFCKEKKRKAIIKTTENSAKENESSKPNKTMLNEKPHKKAIVNQVPIPSNNSHSFDFHIHKFSRKMQCLTLVKNVIVFMIQLRWNVSDSFSGNVMISPSLAAIYRNCRFAALKFDINPAFVFINDLDIHSKFS